MENLRNLNPNEMKTINVQKDALGLVCKYEVIKNDGTSLEVKNQFSYIFATKLGLADEKEIEKCSKAKVSTNPQIEKIDILERNEFFQPNHIRVFLQDGRTINILETASNEISKAVSDYLATGKLQNYDPNNLDLPSYILTCLAEQNNMSIEELYQKAANPPAEEKYFKFGLELAVSAIIGKLLDNGGYCLTAIKSLAVQEQIHDSRVQPINYLDHIGNCNGKLVPNIQYKTLEVIEKKDGFSPSKVKVTYENNNSVQVTYPQRSVQFIDEFAKSKGISYEDVLLGKIPTTKKVENLDIKPKVFDIHAITSKIKNMFGFMQRKEKNQELGGKSK